MSQTVRCGAFLFDDEGEPLGGVSTLDAEDDVETNEKGEEFQPECPNKLFVFIFDEFRILTTFAVF